MGTPLMTSAVHKSYHINTSTQTVFMLKWETKRINFTTTSTLSYSAKHLLKLIIKPDLLTFTYFAAELQQSSVCFLNKTIHILICKKNNKTEKFIVDEQTPCESPFLWTSPALYCKHSGARSRSLKVNAEGFSILHVNVCSNVSWCNACLMLANISCLSGIPQKSFSRTTRSQPAFTSSRDPEIFEREKVRIRSLTAHCPVFFSPKSVSHKPQT